MLESKIVNVKTSSVHTLVLTRVEPTILDDREKAASAVTGCCPDGFTLLNVLAGVWTGERWTPFEDADIDELRPAYERLQTLEGWSAVKSGDTLDASGQPEAVN